MYNSDEIWDQSPCKRPKQIVQAIMDTRSTIPQDFRAQKTLFLIFKEWLLPPLREYPLPERSFFSKKNLY